MKRIFRDRLIKLAAHLKKGRLGHAKFDFSTWHEGEKSGKTCGTAGCAIGECPVVFPRQWTFDVADLSVPVLRVNSGGWPEFDGAEFFGLGDDEFSKLFMPEYRARYGGMRFGVRATRKQVADNILAFVKMKA